MKISGAYAFVNGVDIEALIEQVSAEEVIVDGVTFTLEFERNGIISADGYSLNPGGQGLAANLNWAK